MFEKLSDKLERAFKVLKGQGQITEINVAETTKEIRRALLDADVSFKVAKEFTDEVKNYTDSSELDKVNHDYYLSLVTERYNLTGKEAEEKLEELNKKYNDNGQNFKNNSEEEFDIISERQALVSDYMSFAMEAAQQEIDSIKNVAQARIDAIHQDVLQCDKDSDLIKAKSLDFLELPRAPVGRVTMKWITENQPLPQRDHFIYVADEGA